jgi:hypothetical protein
VEVVQAPAPAQARVLAPAPAPAQVRVRVQLLPQDQVLGQVLVQGQKQVHMLALEPDQDQEAIKDLVQVLDTVRVMEEAVAPVKAPTKVLVMVKVVAMALGLGTGMENEVITSFSLE